MVPRQFQILTIIPLSANGKINHKALPRITTNPESGNSSYQAPTTSLEKTIIVIWEDLLQVQQVGLLDNFFQLGGSSLQAIQLLGRLRQEGYPDLTIAQLFESLTPASQAELLLSLNSASDEISSIKKVEREKEQSLSDQEVEAQLRALLEEK
jgi:aryl carrier-like protein